ncbi:MAG: sigma-54 dependent transcriptional regulator [Gemmatimonadota bacterium]
MTYQLASHESVHSPPPRDPVDFAFRNVVGTSRAIREAIGFARRVAGKQRMTVLLNGETGTGKELFARGIHYAGPAPGEPFVAVNCPAIPPTLLESELFGHERGAFTDARSRKRGLFELSAGGTLFLDEIADLPPDLQPKLLRALEERRVRRLGGLDEIDVRCRVIAGTNRSLEREVAEGNFREDLFYRLNVLRVELPPLRAREDDVLLIARHIAAHVAREQGTPAKDFSSRAGAVLRAHHWPGNVRELKNVVQRAAVLSQGPAIEAEDLAITRRHDVHEQPPAAPEGRAISLPAQGLALDDIVREAVRHTLEITDGNRSRAARILGISRPTLLRKIRTYGLDEPVS